MKTKVSRGIVGMLLGLTMLCLLGLPPQIAQAQPDVFIPDDASFPAYPYNTTAYKQGGAFVGCGPTTGAMIFAYFEHTFYLSGLLDNPVAGVDEGLDTAWDLHTAQYMNTNAGGFGSVYDIKPGMEDYAEDRGFQVKVMVHVSPTNPPESTDFEQYGAYGEGWMNDGDFWVDLGGGNWDYDAEAFCDFVDAKLAQQIAVWLSIDSDGDGGGDHWVPMIGYRTNPTYQYAYYNTFDQSIHWADVRYCGKLPHQVNSISYVRTVEYLPLMDAYVSTAGSDATGDGSMADPWRTIQYAVGHVSSGGTVHVAGGTYNENVVVKNKAMALLGGYSSDFSVRDSTAHVTTINGGGTDRVVHMLWADGSTIDGFAVTGGSTSGVGGGIWVEESDVTVTNNNIWNNTSAGVGAGLCLYDDTSCTVENNLIHDNTGPSAVHLFVDSSTLSNNEIYENTGAGITLYEGGPPPPTIEDNVIRDNDGHGIAAGEGEADIRGNEITGNTGSGISGFQHGGTIAGNVILDNDGWGIDVHEGEIVNNIVSNNSGGIQVLFGVVMMNNTIAGNQGNGGVILNPGEPHDVVNNIIWDNTPVDLPLGSATYSDIGTGNIAGVGNLSLPPEFVDPVTSYDYHLLASSPCIDVGSNAAVPPWLTTDIDGQPRISGMVDMGADEVTPNTPAGTDVTVIDPGTGVEVTFATVTGAGSTSVQTSVVSACPGPAGFELNGVYYDITTTATYSGTITIVIGYDDTGMTLAQEQALQLMHCDSGTGLWNDVTTGVDTGANTVTGEVTSLSCFGIFKQVGLPVQPDLWAVEYRWSQPAPGYSYNEWPIFKSWLEVNIENRGVGDAFNVTAEVTDWPVNTTVPDPTVYVGNIPAGGSGWSQMPDQSFFTRVDMSNPQDPCEGITWQIEYDDAAGVHHVIKNIPQFPPGEGPCDGGAE